MLNAANGINDDPSSSNSSTIDLNDKDGNEKHISLKDIEVNLNDLKVLEFEYKRAVLEYNSHNYLNSYEIFLDVLEKGVKLKESDTENKTLKYLSKISLLRGDYESCLSYLSKLEVSPQTLNLLVKCLLLQHQKTHDNKLLHISKRILYLILLQSESKNINSELDNELVNDKINFIFKNNLLLLWVFLELREYVSYYNLLDKITIFMVKNSTKLKNKHLLFFNKITNRNGYSTQTDNIFVYEEAYNHLDQVVKQIENRIYEEVSEHNLELLTEICKNTYLGDLELKIEGGVNEILQELNKFYNKLEKREVDPYLENVTIELCSSESEGCASRTVDDFGTKTGKLHYTRQGQRDVKRRIIAQDGFSTKSVYLKNYWSSVCSFFYLTDFNNTLRRAATSNYSKDEEEDENIIYPSDIARFLRYSESYYNLNLIKRLEFRGKKRLSESSSLASLRSFFHLMTSQRSSPVDFSLKLLEFMLKNHQLNTYRYYKLVLSNAYHYIHKSLVMNLAHLDEKREVNSKTLVTNGIYQMSNLFNEVLTHNEINGKIEGGKASEDDLDTIKREACTIESDNKRDGCVSLEVSENGSVSVVKVDVGESKVTALREYDRSCEKKRLEHIEKFRSINKEYGIRILFLLYKNVNESLNRRGHDQSPRSQLAKEEAAMNDVIDRAYFLSLFNLYKLSTGDYFKKIHVLYFHVKKLFFSRLDATDSIYKLIHQYKYIIQYNQRHRWSKTNEVMRFRNMSYNRNRIRGMNKRLDKYMDALLTNIGNIVLNENNLEQQLDRYIKKFFTVLAKHMDLTTVKHVYSLNHGSSDLEMEEIYGTYERYLNKRFSEVFYRELQGFLVEITCYMCTHEGCPVWMNKLLLLYGDILSVLSMSLHKNSCNLQVNENVSFLSSAIFDQKFLSVLASTLLIILNRLYYCRYEYVVGSQSGSEEEVGVATGSSVYARRDDGVDATEGGVYTNCLKQMELTQGYSLLLNKPVSRIYTNLAFTIYYLIQYLISDQNQQDAKTIYYLYVAFSQSIVIMLSSFIKFNIYSEESGGDGSGDDGDCGSSGNKDNKSGLKGVKVELSYLLHVLKEENGSSEAESDEEGKKEEDDREKLEVDSDDSEDEIEEITKNVMEYYYTYNNIIDALLQLDVVFRENGAALDAELIPKKLSPYVYVRNDGMEFTDSNCSLNVGIPSMIFNKMMTLYSANFKRNVMSDLKIVHSKNHLMSEEDLSLLTRFNDKYKSQVDEAYEKCAVPDNGRAEMSEVYNRRRRLEFTPPVISLMKECLNKCINIIIGKECRSPIMSLVYIHFKSHENTDSNLNVFKDLLNEMSMPYFRGMNFFKVWPNPLIIHSSGPKRVLIERILSKYPRKINVGMKEVASKQISKNRLDTLDSIESIYNTYTSYSKKINSSVSVRHNMMQMDHEVSRENIIVISDDHETEGGLKEDEGPLEYDEVRVASGPGGSERVSARNKRRVSERTSRSEHISDEISRTGTRRRRRRVDNEQSVSIVERVDVADKQYDVEAQNGSDRVESSGKDGSLNKLNKSNSSGKLVEVEEISSDGDLDKVVDVDKSNRLVKGEKADEPGKVRKRERREKLERIEMAKRSDEVQKEEGTDDEGGVDTTGMAELNGREMARSCNDRTLRMVGGEIVMSRGVKGEFKILERGKLLNYVKYASDLEQYMRSNDMFNYKELVVKYEASPEYDFMGTQKMVYLKLLKNYSAIERANTFDIESYSIKILLEQLEVINYASLIFPRSLDVPFLAIMKNFELLLSLPDVKKFNRKYSFSDYDSTLIISNVVNTGNGANAFAFGDTIGGIGDDGSGVSSCSNASDSELVESEMKSNRIQLLDVVKRLMYLLYVTIHKYNQLMSKRDESTESLDTSMIFYDEHENIEYNKDESDEVDSFSYKMNTRVKLMHFIRIALVMILLKKGLLVPSALLFSDYYVLVHYLSGSFKLNEQLALTSKMEEFVTFYPSYEEIGNTSTHLYLIYLQIKILDRIIKNVPVHQDLYLKIYSKILINYKHYVEILINNKLCSSDVNGDPVKLNTEITIGAPRIKSKVASKRVKNTMNYLNQIFINKYDNNTMDDELIIVYYKMHCARLRLFYLNPKFHHISAPFSFGSEYNTLFSTAEITNLMNNNRIEEWSASVEKVCQKNQIDKMKVLKDIINFMNKIKESNDSDIGCLVCYKLAYYYFHIGDVEKSIKLLEEMSEKIIIPTDFIRFAVNFEITFIKSCRKIMTNTCRILIGLTCEVVYNAKVVQDQHVISFTEKFNRSLLNKDTIKKTVKVRSKSFKKVGGQWIYTGLEKIPKLDSIYKLVKIHISILQKLNRKFKEVSELDKTSLLNSILNHVQNVVMNTLTYCFMLLVYGCPHVLSLTVMSQVLELEDMVAIAESTRVMKTKQSRKMYMAETLNKLITTKSDERNVYEYLEKNKIFHHASITSEYDATTATLDSRLLKQLYTFWSMRLYRKPSEINLKLSEIFVDACNRLLYIAPLDESILENSQTIQLPSGMNVKISDEWASNQRITTIQRASSAFNEAMGKQN